MCGRFSLAVDSAEELLAFFRMRLPQAWEQEPDTVAEALPQVVPRYNVAPSQDVPVARVLAGSPWPGAQLDMLHWGFVPSWSKGGWEDVRKRSYRMINARAETAFDKPSFRRAVARRRLLIPTTGFYEWDRSLPKPRPATLFHRPGRALFAMGGIWERWKGPDGPVDSLAVLTTRANGVVGTLHDRMPVILPRESWEPWLDPDLAERAVIEPLLEPVDDGYLQATVVGTTVNNARSDTAECWEAVETE